MSCEDIPSLLDLQKVKKHADDFGRLMGTGEGDSTNGVTGETRPTYNAVMANLGYTRVGTFAGGATLLNGRQTLLWDVADGGDGQEYGWSGSFPPSGKVVPPGSTPLTTGGIAVGAWMSRFDPELRIQVRESLRRSYADAGYNLVAGSFEAGGTLVNANDVLLQESSGKSFGWAGALPKVVAAGQSVTGFVDKTREGRNPIPFASIAAMQAGAPATNYTEGQKIQVINKSAVSSYIVGKAGDIALSGGLFATEVVEAKKETETTLRVGNDPDAGPYDFTQLEAALLYAAKIGTGGRNNGQFLIRITVPNGTHTFDSINLRGVDLSHVQVWGEDRQNTIVLTEPSVEDNAESSVWFKSRFCKFGDFGNLTLKASPNVKNTTTPSVVCQRWYHSATPPWDTAIHKSFTFFDLSDVVWGRMWGLNISPNTTDIRLGTAFAINASKILEMDDIYVSNIRDVLVAYGRSDVYVSYAGITASQVYNFVVNHESTVSIRKVRGATAFNTVATVSVGSVFIDTFRGSTTVWHDTGAQSISRFDTLFMMDAGIIKCTIPASNFTIYASIINDFGSGNDLLIDYGFNPTTKTLLSLNRVLPWVRNPDENTPNLVPRMGAVEYTGDNTMSRVIATRGWITKATVTDQSTGKVFSATRGTQGNFNNTAALWISEADRTVRVYPGSTNISGTKYLLQWEL